jgi:hypothetical protein
MAPSAITKENIEQRMVFFLGSLDLQLGLATKR